MPTLVVVVESKFYVSALLNSAVSSKSMRSTEFLFATDFDASFSSLFIVAAGIVAADIAAGFSRLFMFFTVFESVLFGSYDEALSLTGPELLYFLLELTLSRVVIELALSRASSVFPSLVTLSAICANCLRLASYSSRCFFSLKSISLS